MTLQSNNSLVKSVAQEKREIIFIDATVEDYQSLIAGINPDTKVVILDRMKDGVSQITENLQGGKYKAVHIVSHGGEGSLQLGSKQLNLGNLDTYKSQLQQWAKYLTDDADILLYGCDVAAGKTGVGFVQQLSQLTGADVAASDDLTGSAALGGDWDLEVKAGKIETSLAFQNKQLQAYNYTLNTPPVIINEWSQGFSGSKEWVELLVTTTTDIRGWKLEDAQGLYTTFSNDSTWQAVAAGTIIVIYNGGDKDTTLPVSDDLSANGDYRIVVAHNNSTLFTPGSWGGFANTGITERQDNPILKNSSGTVIHDWDQNNNSAFTATTLRPGATQAIFYTGNTASGVLTASNYTLTNASTVTPGMPNGGVNTAWINSLRGNNAPVLNTAENPTLPSINEDILSASNTGILLADLIKNLITDTNNNAQGIAVTGLSGNGTWQYSFNGGVNWTNFGAVSDTSATLLAGLTPIYKGSLNSTPNTQGWLQFSAPIGGTQSVSGGMTRLVSTQSGPAGYSNYNAGLAIPLNPAFPTLDRNVGFTLSFDLQVNSESHSSDDNGDGIQDRAGFSVIVVTSHKTKAIELGFWDNEIWAQTASPLFTHSSTERALRSTTAMTRYDLAIKDDTYQLFAAGGTTPILTGSLKDYTAFNHTDAGLPYDPYEQTNFVFLGDNTSSARADVNLARVELQANNKVRFVPNTDYNGTADIKFRAWDGTDGKANGTTGVNVDVNGGTTAYSSDNKAAALTINHVNDRPTFTIGNNQSVKAGTGQQTIAGWAYDFNPGANESTQSIQQYIVEFVNDLDKPLFNNVAPTIDSSSGNLKYTPTSTVASSKTVQFRVKAQDNGGTDNGGVDSSDAKTFTITVNSTATNSMNGGSGEDNLIGTDQSDRISGLDNDDTIYGGLGSDRIFGNNGNDTLYGDLETIPTYGVNFTMDDTIAGGLGSDRIYGNGGNDKLYGDEGDDQIWGGDGNDEIWGGYGNDILNGGLGKDAFVLVRGQGADIIMDFTSEDVLGCAGALKYSSLIFTKQNGDTLITDISTNQLLATLKNFTGTPNNGGQF